MSTHDDSSSASKNPQAATGSLGNLLRMNYFQRFLKEFLWESGFKTAAENIRRIRPDDNTLLVDLPKAVEMRVIFAGDAMAIEYDRWKIIRGRLKKKITKKTFGALTCREPEKAPFQETGNFLNKLFCDINNARPLGTLQSNL